VVINDSNIALFSPLISIIQIRYCRNLHCSTRFTLGFHVSFTFKIKLLVLNGSLYCKHKPYSHENILDQQVFTVTKCEHVGDGMYFHVESGDTRFKLFSLHLHNSSFLLIVVDTVPLNVVLHG
jgi:hypothetical protein